MEGDWAAAESQFRIALAGGADKDRAAFGIARAQFSHGDYAGAIDSLNRLMSSPPSDDFKLRAYYLLGETHSAQSEWEPATAAYQSAIGLGPSVLDEILLERSGDALLSDHHPEQAVQAFAAAALATSAADRPRLSEKEADAMRMAGSNEPALQLYDSIMDQVASDTARARLHRKAGLVLIDLDRKPEAYERYKTALQYASAYDAYLCLADLLDAGFAVDEYQRGSIDYFAGQYDAAVAALSRYLSSSPTAAGPALYRRGLAYLALGNPDAALQDLREAVQLGSESGIWELATFEIAQIEWADQEEYASARQTLVAFVDEAPNHPRAAEALYEAARIAERGNDLAKAAELWKRVADSYPASGFASDARHFSGISLYRSGNYSEAEAAFSALTNSVDSETIARAWFWIAKAKLARGDSTGHQQAMKIAAASDATGYYSLRAEDTLAGHAPFFSPASSNFDFNLDSEYAQAAEWVHQQLTSSSTSQIPLPDESAARDNPRLVRGRLLWDLGLYADAQSDFTDVRTSVASNPLASLYLSQYFAQIGFFPGAIYAARATLDDLKISGTATFSAPAYFNHIRFGPYFKDLIVPAAQSFSLDPLLVFALVRQESMFGTNAASTAAALGLMQLIPSTAQDVAKRQGLDNHTDSDLYRPVINVRLGTAYLSYQRDLFKGDLMLALAAYNGGPGNALAWQTLSNGDADLLAEVIRYEETRLYIRHIYEYNALYRTFYGK